MAVPIIVAGTGPAGLIAALSLTKAGFAVELAGPEITGEDRRTTALMQPALRFLERLGVRDALVPFSAPLRVMRVADATQRLIRGPAVTFRAIEIGEPWFGINMPNAQLTAVLREAIERQPAITWHRGLIERWEPGAAAVAATLAGGSRIEAPLAVAADGRNSAARAAAGIAVSARSYHQSALVLNFGHSRPHAETSTEFHTETGPFTQVPLPGDGSSLVWVERPAVAAELSALDDAALSQRVEEKMQSMLGRVTVEPGRQLYPLSAALPSRFAGNRIALIGEAAHVFPPIGAQGLNLGIRDIGQLVETLALHRADPGSAAALSAYDGRRRPDILARTGAVTLLNVSLLSDMLPAQLLRSAGLGLLGSSGALRGLFMREGLESGSGLAALLPLRERGRAAASRS